MQTLYAYDIGGALRCPIEGVVCEYRTAAALCVAEKTPSSRDLHKDGTQWCVAPLEACEVSKCLVRKCVCAP